MYWLYARLCGRGGLRFDSREFEKGRHQSSFGGFGYLIAWITWRNPRDEEVAPWFAGCGRSDVVVCPIITKTGQAGCWKSLKLTMSTGRWSLHSSIDQALKLFILKKKWSCRRFSSWRIPGWRIGLELSDLVKLLSSTTLLNPDQSGAWRVLKKPLKILYPIQYKKGI